MNGRQSMLLGWLTWIVVGAVGCHDAFHYDYQKDQLHFYKDVATQIDYPDVDQAHLGEVDRTQAPRTLSDPHFDSFWDLTLEEAVRVALENSKIMRDLGGRVVAAPGTVASTYLPAIQESDPRFGTEGVLSAFDAQLSTSLFWEKNDRPLNRNANNLALFPQLLEQDLGTFSSELAKRTATGARFFLRNDTQYEWSNDPTRLFPSAWNTSIDAGFTQPLLQGAGVKFNRIAGPDSTPGFYNGVIIARLNNDISLADFEAGVRTLVSDVENAYWDLYFAYRDLDAKKVGRDTALKTWRNLKTRADTTKDVGKAEESQAREQYFFFRAQVENALSGAPGQSTQSGAGSAAGSFRGAGGVYARENNLRFLMGLSANDGRVIRPADEPSIGRIAFDWDEVLNEALCRRVELRRQKWVIRQKEMELIAARNFIKPRLDAVGRYRWVGMGDDLIDPNGSGNFDNAWQTLTEGNFQEWQLGLQFSMPVGFRQAMAGVRNAQLQLARERSVLEDQELQVSHDLTGAIRELDRAYTLMQTNYNRRAAALRQLEAITALYEAGTATQKSDPASTLNLVLDAQRRVADAEIEYFRSVVEYTLAVKSVHFEKGSLLDYNGVELAEGPWPAKAYRDAKRRAFRRWPTRKLDYSYARPDEVSRGRYRQATAEPGLPALEYQGQGFQEWLPEPPVEQPQTPRILPAPAAARPLPPRSAEAGQNPNHQSTNTAAVPARSVKLDPVGTVAGKQPDNWKPVGNTAVSQSRVGERAVSSPPPASVPNWVGVQPVRFDSVSPSKNHERSANPPFDGPAGNAAGWKRAKR